MRSSTAAAMALLLMADATAPALARLHLGRSDAGTLQCIKLRAIRDETAENDTSLLFHAGGDRVYRNTLPKPCDNLRSVNNLGKLRLHPSGDTDLCKGDTIELSDPGSVLGVVGLSDDTGGTRTCTLGDFEPISEMSVTELLRR